MKSKKLMTAVSGPFYRDEINVGSNLTGHQCCPYCSNECQRFGTHDRNFLHAHLDYYHVVARLHVCQVCGWWTIPTLAFHEETDIECMRVLAGQVRGELAAFDTEASDLPIQELTRYLCANYQARHAINPFLIEDAVGAIFRSCGYEVIATPRSRDNGIDLFIIQRSDNIQKAVQIKRYRDKVGAELIRSFAGALLYHGLTHGVFVTTGEFTFGAKATATTLQSQRGYRIELLDASRLFDMLRISQCPAYFSINDSSSPFAAFWREPLRIAQTTIQTMYRVEI